MYLYKVGSNDAEGEKMHQFYHEEKYTDRQLQKILAEVLVELVGKEAHNSALMGCEFYSEDFVSAVNLAKESGLTPGEKHEKVLKNLSVKAMWAREGDRPVIRIILPDKHNHLEREDLDEDFAQQYEETSYEQF